MSNVLSKMKMRTPNCSAFPVKWTNKISNRIGNLVPIKWIEMGPNDRCKLSLSQLTRFFPLSAPAMANFRLTVDAVFVPSRIISKKYEKFFNAGTKDSDRPNFPSINYADYIEYLFVVKGLFTPELLDFLGFPTFENCKDFFRNLVNSFNNYSSNPIFSGLLDLSPVVNQDSVGEAWNGIHFPACYVTNDGFVSGVVPSVSARDPYKGEFVLDVDDYIQTFARFIFGGATEDYFIEELVRYGYDLREEGLTFEDLVDRYCSINNVHIEDLVNDYLSYVVRAIARSDIRAYNGNFFGNNLLDYLIFYNDDDILTSPPQEFYNKRFSLLPIFSFWKAYFDWYVNSVLENGQELTDEWTDYVTDVVNNGYSFDEFPSFSVGYPTLRVFFGALPHKGALVLSSLTAIPTRLWSVDRFTGAYTDLQNGQPVLIPVDGTMLDLKASNRLWQYLQKALYGGTRTIDKNEIIYGAHSSNQLLDRTEVLCRKHFDIDIQQVSNTAASEAFDLGTLAGQGFGLGGDFLFDYTCEERGYIMVFASVTVPPSYISALDRTLLHTDYYDFFIPEFDGVGEVEIGAEELYFDKGMRLDPIGYNRRNYEGIDFLSEVHGDFKNSLKHWHDARDFKVAPTLSPEFIHINVENDNLERLFATYSHDQIMHFFAFKGVVVRPMSKFVQFGL